jgi:hypothetical protein
MSNQIAEAIAKFAEAIKALKDAGVITSADQLSIQPQDAPVAPQSDAAVEAAQETVGAAPATTTAVEAAPATKAKPVMPQRGEGGRFLKRDGSSGKSKKVAKEVSKRVVAPGLVDDFVAWFFQTPQEGLYNVKCGQYECRLGDVAQKTAHTLIFHSSVEVSTWVGNERIRRRGTPTDANNIIGIRPIDSKIGVFNASRLLYGTHHAAQLRPQVAAEKAGAVPIPFQNVVSRSAGAGLDLSKLEIMDWSGPENLIIPPVARGRNWGGDFYVVQRHFAGAMVVRIEDKYFLFDADREELSNFGFNPFFTQLPGPANTVHEAYELLMPESVKQALQEGREVKRQGEFFFIPLTLDEILGHVIDGPVRSVNKHRTVCLFMDVERRLNDVGAAHFNLLQRSRLRSLDGFIKRCNEHSSGLLPETTVDGTNERAEDLFKPLTEHLAQLVGTPVAQGMLGGTNMIDELSTVDLDQRKLDPYYSAMRFIANNPRTTHLALVADDLARECRTTTEQTDTTDTTTTQVGPYAKQFGIMFDMRIGETPTADDWRARQHRATAVLQSPRIKGDVLAIGAVIHEGREHRPVFLNTWHKVVGNTATNNWTVSGDVD